MGNRKHKKTHKKKHTKKHKKKHNKTKKLKPVKCSPTSEKSYTCYSDDSLHFIKKNVE